jgi:tetratricopeptide (TPR) repeat protein
MGMRSRRRHKGGGLTEERLRAVRAEVNALLKESRKAEAKEVLLRFNACHPGHAEILERMADLAYETDDSRYLQAAMEGLRLLRPETPELLLALGGAALSNHYLATGLQALRSVLDKWPWHPGAAEARILVKELEEDLPKVLSELGVEGEQGMGVALQHERIQLLLTLGLTRQAREVALALHAARPQFTAALNNFGMAAWMDGDYTESEEAFRKVLTTHPDNVHAHVGLIRVLLLSGRGQEAWALAERIKDLEALTGDRWLAIALAFSYLGDDEGVLRAFTQAQREGSVRQDSMRAQLKHMAAVAALRRGDFTWARLLLEQALKEMPGLEPAKRNLEALDDPAALRRVPWAIDLEGWLPTARLEALRKQVLERCVELHLLAPLLLDRGDPNAVALALSVFELLARGSRLEAPLAAELKRFCLGERGHMAERVKAGRILLMAGAAREEELQLWTGKHRQPYGWFDTELHAEPGPRHATEGEEQAVHAQAEQALFARCEEVRTRIHQGRLQEARELLEPLLAQRRLHFSEFSILCAVHMDLLIAEDDRESALVWLDFLEGMLPKDGFVEIYRTKLGARPRRAGTA